MVSKFDYVMEGSVEYKALSLKLRVNRVKPSLVGLRQTWGGTAKALQAQEEEEGEVEEWNEIFGKTMSTCTRIVRQLKTLACLLRWKKRTRGINRAH